MAEQQRMKKDDQRPPDLNNCIEQFVALYNEKSKSIESLGALYLAAIGVLYHLRLDQKTIFSRRQQKENNDDEVQFPKPWEIPAMTAILLNQPFLRSLISCMKSNSTDGFEASSVASSSVGTASQLNLMYTPGARKRGLSWEKNTSISTEVMSKSMKLAHGQSPMVGKRTVMGNITKPQMDIKMLAGTILYVAMESIDHWPAPMIEAYAEDCFGPRSWVDDPAYRLLVDNLSLIHRDDDNGDHGGGNCGDLDVLLADASKVAEFFRKNHSRRYQNTTIMSTEANMKRSSSMSAVHEKRAFTLKRQRSESVGSQNSKKTSFSPQQKLKTKVKSDILYESDSGDEEEVAITTSYSKYPNDGGGSSSSSGEDEDNPIATVLAKPTYPVQQKNLIYSQVRRRYFGQNLESAFVAVSDKLSQRLDMKSKQNSGLLQCLTSFTSIPSVRIIITGNLEKWLQSPALSGLARALFSKTVNSMKNTDPPLREDLSALDNILRMRLKANQLNAHIENVTAVATRIPTVTITKHIYRHILREILVNMDSHDSTLSDHLSMIHAVHDVLPRELSAIGIASTLFELLLNRPDPFNDLATPNYIRRIQELIRAIASKFGSSFDGCIVLNAMLSLKADPKYAWSIIDEENKARLMFQCVTLLVDPGAMTQRIQPTGKSVRIVNPSEESVAKVKAKLIEARKLLIRWCCVDYAPFYSLESEQKNTTKARTEKKKDEITGAGTPIYSSILDGDGDRSFSPWVKVMRSVLFLEKSDSPILGNFLFMGHAPFEDVQGWEDEAKRINFCCDNGADVDDEMLWTVVQVASNEIEGVLSKDIALLLLEHMFERCKKGMKSSLLVHDPTLILKLYELAEYIPSVKSKQDISHQLNGGCKEMPDGKENNQDVFVPRLGYPGMWWRVTGLALILCGASPSAIGDNVLKNFPTLKALIKMITSDRYRFPTVDSDDAARKEQKRIEQAMRDEEGKLAEYLFAPPNKVKKKAKYNVHKIDSGTQSSGQRSSKRQQAKREQEINRQRQKEEAEAQAEASRRKKLLKTAQKSITIWDPYKGPRKPPKESIDLIFSIGELFDLKRVFQSSTEPDFLLTTIGSTTRGAIERAHDWLIPIISFLPETVSRLPASASCFLLIRAYGTNGDERTGLHELSAPLLQHVRDSLIGDFGETDAVRTFDLLLTDIANHDPDRRRCARRVLTNAIGKENLGEIDTTFDGSNHAWAINLMHVKHSKSIVSDAIQRLAIAASFERGGNLRYLVLALNKLTRFAKNYGVEGDWDFASLFIELVSKRPTVFANALSSYTDLRSLAIEVVGEEFRAYVDGKISNLSNKNNMVHISLCRSDKNGSSIKVEMPLALLQSSCVLLSIWSEDDARGRDSTAIEGLVIMLMNSREYHGEADITEKQGTENVDGLASAKILVTQKTAIAVESWVMLAKSRSDFIAKRAALAAPTNVLPRLLLCSGLPRASLVTMINRLGKLGEKADDIHKTFTQLLVPSASSEWDLGRLGHRREISRKLLGRVCAYSRLYRLSELNGKEEVSFVFVEWLSNSCRSSRKPTKLKAKKPKIPPPKIYECIENAKMLFDSMSMDMLGNTDVSSAEEMHADTSDMTNFLLFQDETTVSLPITLDDAVENFLVETFKENKSDLLDNWLLKNFSHEPFPLKKKRRNTEEKRPRLGNEELAFLLLKCYTRLERKVESISSTLVKWIPKLSSLRGSPKFWRILFARGQKPAFLWDNLISRCFQVWDREHMTRCRQWILSNGRKEELDLVKTVRFLILASRFPTINVDSFVDLTLTAEYETWGRTEEAVRSATGLALDCLLSFDYETRLRSRSDAPECLVLLLLIAKLGRNQVQFVTGAIMERLQNDDEQNERLLLLSLLRIYAYLPFSMNLSTAALRSNLMKAVELSAEDWLSWRSPLDDSVREMIGTAFSNTSSLRSVQSLFDVAKKHPLLLLRKLEMMENILEKDASDMGTAGADDKAGLVRGQGLNEPLIGAFNGKELKLFVKHWGYNYTEHIWSSILDVISAVPNEVLFQCGLKMGLLELLGAYLRLVLVQSQLRTNNDRLVNLKERISEVLGRFQTANLKSFDSWMASRNCGLPSLGATRNVMVGCGFLSPQQAMDSVKRTYASAPKNVQS